MKLLTILLWGSSNLNESGINTVRSRNINRLFKCLSVLLAIQTINGIEITVPSNLGLSCKLYFDRCIRSVNFGSANLPDPTFTCVDSPLEIYTIRHFNAIIASQTWTVSVFTTRDSKGMTGAGSRNVFGDIPLLHFEAFFLRPVGTNTKTCFRIGISGRTWCIHTDTRTTRQIAINIEWARVGNWLIMRYTLRIKVTTNCYLRTIVRTGRYRCRIECTHVREEAPAATIASYTMIVFLKS